MLPKKSITTPHTSIERSSNQITKRDIANAAESLKPPRSCYKDFSEFVKRSKALQLDVSMKESENTCQIAKQDGEHAIPKYEITVDNNLNYSIRAFCWQLPDDNFLVKSHEGSLQNVTLSKLVKEIDDSVLCPGPSLKSNLKCSNSDVKLHVIQKLPLTHTQHMKPLSQDEYLRAISCHVLMDNSSPNPCRECKSKEQYELKQDNRKEKIQYTPAKLKAPLSATHPERVKLALQQNRLECKQLQIQMQEMKREIDNAAKPVSQELGHDLVKLFSGCDQRKIPPFMKFFWEEQQKYLQQSSSQVRYHPMIIKFCLALAAKSSSTYNEMRLNEKEGTGILVLPSLRTLRDYRNYIRPKRGFNDQVVADLKKKTAAFAPQERYIVISFDEMKIQEDLVWDKNTGELIGFVDLGDVEVNYGTLPKSQELASHVLVFLIKSIVNPLSYSFATFATTGVTAFQLFPLFWRSVAILEGTCSLHVVAAVGDGASSNRSFFKMHKGMGGQTGKDVVYRSINLFAPDRFIFFFSDAPHLMKTARNNLAKSKCGNASRLLWNNGCYLLWSHITHIYEEDIEYGLKLLPKITGDHVKLTPNSAMRVRLAVQILSTSMAAILKEYGPEEAKGTSDFCQMMDMFFDCMNVRNTVEYRHKQKLFMAPYESTQDHRFGWLEDVF